MKKDLISTSIASAILTVALCGSAAATMGSYTTSHSAQEDNMLNVKQLIGQSVVNQRGQSIGSLNTVMLNRSVGSASYGVIRQHGTSYKVPWNLMQETSAHQIKLDVKGTNLEADFTALQPAQMTASNQVGKHSFLNSKNPFLENNSNDMGTG